VNEAGKHLETQIYRSYPETMCRHFVHSGEAEASLSKAIEIE
jgi:hypothetical protein